MTLESRLIIASIAALVSAMPLPAEPSKPLSFNRDIRPILSDNCFSCHGFDAKKREAKLRLDVAEGAYKANEDGVIPIQPGDLARSEAWLRIVSDDKDEMMPPPKSHKKLTAEQKEMIKRWIEEGARYQNHWAFETPVKPVVPAVEGGAGAIDAFVAARLTEERLTFSPEADRETLIRRASFALTGLPPTLAEVEAFAKDPSADAYAKMIHRYLQSPRYGEEMARHWLDVARYADTHGLHLDNERNMWAYRDWVVKSFNENLPFDQSTVWQIAGDLLPNATPDQIAATGFNRCNVTTSEGGAIAEEFLYRYAVDRTSTAISAWMGLTGGCAVCHDHKYDPLTTRDFYALYSLFYSAADPGMDGNIANTEPVIRVPAKDQQQRLTEATKKEQQALQILQQTAAKAAYAEPADVTPAPPKQKITQVIFDDAFLPGSALLNTTRNPSVWEVDPAFGAKSGHRVLKQANSGFHEDRVQSWVVPVVIPEQGHFEVWVRPDAMNPPSMLAVSAGSQRVFWGDEAKLDIAYNVDRSGTRQGEMPKPGEWTKLSFSSDALKLKPGARNVAISVQQVGGVVWWDQLTLTGEVSPAGSPLWSFNTWWKGAGDIKLKPYETTDVPGEIREIISKGPAKPRTAEERKRLLEYYLAIVAQPVNKDVQNKRATWETARVARDAASDAIASTLVFRDLDTPRAAFVMMRGQYDKPGDAVQPAAPAFLPAFQKANPTARATRLDLARWLVSQQHPLTARVTVNRLWQQFFGIGLVKTSHDFGSQGEPPSHPELLDWLAVTFQESGWDVKQLVRSMVMSRAFRQQSAVTPALLQKDPENRLLARGPRFRLDAEQIRDNALFVSGLIDLEMGGRGVRTYQPPNIWEPVGYGDSNTRYYLQDHGAALYRRSLYVFLKRTAPPPFMVNFDAPNREQSCLRRERSDTPMQALQLLNDPQHFEAARALAERLLKDAGPDDAGRLVWLFRTVLSRHPDKAEQTMLTQALARQRSLYQADPKAAREAIEVGESKPKNIAPAEETAAWTLVANLVLNLDETITRN